MRPPQQLTDASKVVTKRGIADSALDFIFEVKNAPTHKINSTGEVGLPTGMFIASTFAAHLKSINSDRVNNRRHMPLIS